MSCGINPLSWGDCVGDGLSTAVGGLASSGFAGLANAFASGVGNIVKTLATFWTATPTTSLSTDSGSPVGMLTGMLDWIMLAVGLMAILIVAAKMGLTQRGDALAEGGAGLARFVLVQAAQVPAMELAARYADALFGAGSTKQDCVDAYADIKGRMPRYGRPPEALKILPGVSVFTGRTRAEADGLYQELQSLISPALGVHYLSKMVTCDLSGLPIDGPLPALADEVLGGSSLRTFIVGSVRREGLSIRQTYERVLPSIGGPMFKGSPTDVADEMEDWFRSGAGDGFTIMAPVQPRGLRDFVDLVVPELQRRGLFRTEYTADTLRGHLELPIPASRWQG